MRAVEFGSSFVVSLDSLDLKSQRIAERNFKARERGSPLLAPRANVRLGYIHP